LKIGYSYILRYTLYDCGAVALGLSFCERATREKERALTRVKKVETTARTRYLALGLLIVASLFIFSDRFYSPMYTTESNNARFNQWVDYYSRCDGYTVEYNNFETYTGESDVMTFKQASILAGDVKKVRQITGLVTVYFDWENDVIFYSGSGPDSTLQYCYYSNY